MIVVLIIVVRYLLISGCSTGAINVPSEGRSSRVERAEHGFWAAHPKTSAGACAHGTQLPESGTCVLRPQPLRAFLQLHFASVVAAFWGLATHPDRRALAASTASGSRASPLLAPEPRAARRCDGRFLRASANNDEALLVAHSPRPAQRASQVRAPWTRLDYASNARRTAADRARARRLAVVPRAREKHTPQKMTSMRSTEGSAPHGETPSRASTMTSMLSNDTAIGALRLGRRAEPEPTMQGLASLSSSTPHQLGKTKAMTSASRFGSAQRVPVAARSPGGKEALKPLDEDAEMHESEAPSASMRRARTTPAT